jgi:hypothetical protein
MVEIARAIPNAGVAFVANAGVGFVDACDVPYTNMEETISVGSAYYNDAATSVGNVGSCLDIYSPVGPFPLLGVNNDTATYPPLYSSSFHGAALVLLALVPFTLRMIPI